MTSRHGKKHYYYGGALPFLMFLLGHFYSGFQWESVPRPLLRTHTYIYLLQQFCLIECAQQHVEPFPGFLFFFFNANTERISIIIFKFNLERKKGVKPQTSLLLCRSPIDPPAHVTITHTKLIKKSHCVLRAAYIASKERSPMG